MKILGIGTDIVNIKRLDKIFKKRGIKFKKRIFTKSEIKYCDNKINSGSFYAKRFAAKEAFSKALGTGIGNNVHFKNIEIFTKTLKNGTFFFFKRKVNVFWVNFLVLVFIL